MHKIMDIVLCLPVGRQVPCILSVVEWRCRELNSGLDGFLRDVSVRSRFGLEQDSKKPTKTVLSYDCFDSLHHCVIHDVSTLDKGLIPLILYRVSRE